jgi:hypothetical protein
MTFLEAALEILRRERKPLHYKDITEKAMERKLLTFVGRTPEVTMQTQLTAAVKKAPGNPFVRVKPATFGLLRYPEAMPEVEPPLRSSSAGERPRALAAAGERPRAAAGTGERSRPAAGAGERSRPAAGAGERSRPAAGAAAEARGRRRRRGGRGRSRSEDARLGPAMENGAAVGSQDRPSGAVREETMSEDDDNPADGPEEPAIDTLSPEARAAALAESGVLESEGDDELDGNDGDLEGDEGDLGDEPIGLAEESGEPSEGAGDGDRGREETTPMRGASRFGKAANNGNEVRGEAEGMEGQEAGQDEDEDEDEDEEVEQEELAAGPAVSAGAAAGAAPLDESQTGRRRRRRRRRRGGSDAFGEETAPGAESSLGEAAGESEEGASLPSPQGGASDAGGGAPAGSMGGEGESSAGRRIMSPIDAAIEILRGQSPGRGMHVRQLADAGTRRRLVHGEPSEAWRVMRPPDLDLERAEHVFGEARRALRERTLAALELRMAELSPAAFEAIARVLLQREGFGPATFVKRVEGTIYLEALRGRGARPSRCLIALRSSNGPAGRRSIGELRAGIRARNQDEGVLLLAGRLAEDAISEWKQPGPPLEVADGAALAETCIRHGVGVINTMVSVDFVDADFFAELQEG